MQQPTSQTAEDLTHEDFIQQAHSLVPLLREKARESEMARRPLDEVMDAVRATDLFSMMVPKRYGGHEADMDTFFEVSLILSRADASMGWLIGFYIEHAFWFCHFPQSVQDEIFGDADHILAPAALNPGGGMAREVEGGYRHAALGGRAPGWHDRASALFARAALVCCSGQVSGSLGFCGDLALAHIPDVAYGFLPW
mgnify:CR=1 FL=1